MPSQVESGPGMPKTVYSGSEHQDFTVEATDVGNLTSIQVRIAATGTTSTWNLDHINVTPPASSDGAAPAPKDCVFAFKDWLIPDNGFYTINKQLQEVEFKAKVITGDYSDPFDGDVYITMTGLDGTGTEQKLTNDQTTGNFLASAVSEFKFKTGDPGQLSNISVRMVRTFCPPASTTLFDSISTFCDSISTGCQRLLHMVAVGQDRDHKHGHRRRQLLPLQLVDELLEQHRESLGSGEAKVARVRA